MGKIIIKIIFQIIPWAIALIAGFVYLADAVGKSALPYLSMPRLLESIGAGVDGKYDITSIKGCFLCPYVRQLFKIIGNATEGLWDIIIDHTWILLAIGLVIFMFWEAYKIIMDANKENAELSEKERKLDFPTWFKKVKGQLIRVLIVGILIGGLGMGGKSVMQLTTDVIVYPVMKIGTIISMAATETIGYAKCEEKVDDAGPMSSISNAFMCVIGNLNTVVLRGAATGFAMMDGAWIGLGGGFFGWISGLLIIFMFLYIGFNIIFKVLNVVFNLVLIIIFMPVFFAAYAFEATWNMAKNVFDNVIAKLTKTAGMVIGITIEVLIMTSLVTASMESFQLDPEINIEIAKKCEDMAFSAEGELDKDLYKKCFLEERDKNPEAFAYLDRSFELLVMMFFNFIIYLLLLHPKLQQYIDTSDKEAYFRFGDFTKGLIKGTWNGANRLIKGITGVFTGGGTGDAGGGANVQ